MIASVTPQIRSMEALSLRARQYDVSTTRDILKAFTASNSRRFPFRLIWCWARTSASTPPLSPLSPTSSDDVSLMLGWPSSSTHSAITPPTSDCSRLCKARNYICLGLQSHSSSLSDAFSVAQVSSHVPILLRFTPSQRC